MRHGPNPPPPGVGRKSQGHREEVDSRVSPVLIISPTDAHILILEVQPPELGEKNCPVSQPWSVVFCSSS